MNKLDRPLPNYAQASAVARPKNTKADVSQGAVLLGEPPVAADPASGPLWRYLLPLAVMAMWGSLPVANKIGLTAMPPLPFATWRAVVSSALFIPMLPLLVRKDALRNWRPNVSDAVWLIVVGTLQTSVFFYCISEGLKWTSAGVAAVILNLQPLLTALLAYLALGEKLAGRSAIGLSIAFMCLPLVTLSNSANSFDPVGYGLIAAATLSWSIATLAFKRKVASRTPPMLATAIQLWIGSAILWAACVAAGQTQIPAFTPAMIGSVLYTSIFGTCIPYALWFMLLRRLSTPYLSSFTCLIPIFAVFLGYIILGENLSSLQVLGVAGAIAGVAIAVLDRRALDRRAHGL